MDQDPDDIMDILGEDHGNAYIALRKLLRNSDDGKKKRKYADAMNFVVNDMIAEKYQKHKRKFTFESINLCEYEMKTIKSVIFTISSYIAYSKKMTFAEPKSQQEVIKIIEQYLSKYATNKYINNFTNINIENIPLNMIRGDFIPNAKITGTEISQCGKHMTLKTNYDILN